jgi:hypothetical protein
MAARKPATTVDTQNATGDAEPVVARTRTRKPRSSRKRAEAAGAASPAATNVPAAAAPGRRTWKQDLADVQRVGFWLWLGILWVPSLTLSALSGPEVASTVFKAVQAGGLSPTEAASIWKVLVLTAPFTSAVAIVGVATLRGWFSSDDWFPALYFSTLVLFVTTLVSKGLSIGAQVEIVEVSPINWVPFNWAINLAYAYYRVYTPWMFVASLAVGTFLAWTWSAKVMPHLQGEASTAAAAPHGEANA